MKPERVYFYSKYDGAIFKNMELAEQILINFSEDKDFNINDIIELYQVKLHIDNEIYPTKWKKGDLKIIKEKCVKIWSIVVRFWNDINSENLLELFNQLECWTLQKAFWELTASLSIYKKISKETFAQLLEPDSLDIRAILYQEKIANYYSNELKEFLLSYDNTTELLLSQYVQKHDSTWNNLYFPKSLTIDDKEKIIIKYLYNEEPNLNYVRLILNIKKHPSLTISDKTRLKAKRLEEKLNSEIFSGDNTVSYGVSVAFDEQQIEPKKRTTKKNTGFYTYSTKYILKHDHPVFYLSHFNNLFEYLNEQRCISIVSKESDLDSFEKTLISAENEYPIGLVFNRKDILSLSQLYLYERVLEKHNKQNIEHLVKYYIEEHLSDNFGLKGFRFNLPSNGTGYFEKIRMLFAEFDVLLRQYKLFHEEKELDIELLRMSTTPYYFSQIPSFVSKKYCYPKGDKLSQINYLFFSDQSSLSYAEPFKGKYRCLYDLLLNEEVLYGNYKSYQWARLDVLFEEGYLLVEHTGIIRIKNRNQLFVLFQLYNEEVLNYWHYTKECRDIIDKMVDEDILYFEDKLFNRLECNYLNYYLNKKEFTNGLDLRNSFMHGTNPDSENELIRSYYILIRIIVLTILKIDDDQFLNQKLRNLVIQPKN